MTKKEKVNSVFSWKSELLLLRRRAGFRSRWSPLF